MSDNVLSDDWESGLNSVLFGDAEKPAKTEKQQPAPVADKGPKEAAAKPAARAKPRETPEQRLERKRAEEEQAWSKFEPYTKPENPEYGAPVDEWYKSAALPYHEAAVGRAEAELDLARRAGSGVSAAKANLDAKKALRAQSQDEYEKLRSGQYIWTGQGLTPASATVLSSKPSEVMSEAPRVEMGEVGQQELEPIRRESIPLTEVEVSELSSRLLEPYVSSELDESYPRKSLKEDVSVGLSRVGSVFGGRPKTRFEAFMGRQRSGQKMSPYFVTHADERYKGMRSDETGEMLKELDSIQQYQLFNDLFEKSLNAERELKESAKAYSAIDSRAAEYREKMTEGEGDEWLSAAAVDSGPLMERLSGAYNDLFAKEARANSLRQALLATSDALGSQAQAGLFNWQSIVEQESSANERIGRKTPTITPLLSIIPRPKNQDEIRLISRAFPDSALKSAVSEILPGDMNKSLSIYQQLGKLIEVESYKKDRMISQMRRFSEEPLYQRPGSDMWREPVTLPSRDGILRVNFGIEMLGRKAFAHDADVERLKLIRRTMREVINERRGL